MRPSVMPPARQDGRPLYYDISPHDRVQCVLCLRNGIRAQYKKGEAFMADPANSPMQDGAVYTICKGHIPEDSVIFDPGNQLCRTKDGTETWKEV